MISRLWLLWLIAIPGLTAQSLQQEDILRLARIKTAIKKHLQGMPNYTCLQTVERYQRFPNAKTEALIDVLRLEVAYVTGREMYAWPGSTQFEDTELREIVTTGAFSTGAFALHARAIFLGDGTTFRFGGEEDFEGKPALRFDYDTAQFRSGYQIRNPRRGIGAVVAYHGSIWAHRETFELFRISVEADEIPDEIEIVKATDRLDYQLMKIGSGEALLPRQSEVQILDNRGKLAINRTRLSRCKQYSGESTLSFEDVGEAGEASSKQTRILQFDPFTELELALDFELNHDSFAVGDAIQAVLRNEIRDGKNVIAQKGSIAKGRILRLEHQIGDYSTYNITLQFDELLGPDWRAPLKLRLTRTEPETGTPPDLRIPGRTIRMVTLPDTQPNGFLVFSKKLKLSRGFTTIWQTQ
jgi:hypothetical protein